MQTYMHLLGSCKHCWPHRKVRQICGSCGQIEWKQPSWGVLVGSSRSSDYKISKGVGAEQVELASSVADFPRYWIHGSLQSQNSREDVYPSFEIQLGHHLLWERPPSLLEQTIPASQPIARVRRMPWIVQGSADFICDILSSKGNFLDI